MDCAFTVHQKMGPGLLEGIYEDCFVVEFDKRGIKYERQKIIHVTYDGVTIPTHYKIDLIVEGKIILELKSVENFVQAHTAQILTYMKTSNIRTGFLINFGEPYFKRGIKRFVI